MNVTPDLDHVQTHSVWVIQTVSQFTWVGGLTGFKVHNTRANHSVEVCVHTKGTHGRVEAES